MFTPMIYAISRDTHGMSRSHAPFLFSGARRWGARPVVTTLVVAIFTLHETPRAKSAFLKVLSGSDTRSVCYCYLGDYLEMQRKYH